MLPYVTLKRNGEFNRAYRRGQAFVHPAVVTYVFRRKNGGGLRVGITTGKKVGGAVARNRARRVLRAALAQVLAGGAAAPYDIVLVARGATPGLKSTRLVPVLRRHLLAGGVLTHGDKAADGPSAGL